ncbi:MAG: AAA family ATPase [Nostoc sp. DedQUE12b]|uniref:AAA family ATPase n=1 Tax=Nostoc sp. DedQUE12b TaxID=3075398 RepID=UPI002AD5289F|nr:AAA family ATPase [Nostoc sp. DedQUE12b]MDZ8087997.1 AAA family ATPase [Nostoc sp. DedQUE12b]
MLEIPEYKIWAKIHESANSRVYRGIRERDHLPLIFKILKKDYPTREEITRYKLEYEITRSLSLEGVIQAYGLQQYHSTFAIILEDFGGESLTKITAARRFSLTEFLKLAVQIAEVLGEIHTANIIHKDINPSNIVLNIETQQLKIIDFGISTARSQEKLTLKNPTVLEGTLAYISPEQTGRMNRSLDYRTDFYSLGVTFYQLLTHRLPFESSDALELIHYHLALEPVPPHVIDPEIPVIVSEIVLKLLAKTAEDRYQSAWGIKNDLEQCLMELQHRGRIEPFLLAQQDISDKFHIPEKLYGREREIETLLAAFARVAGNRDGERDDLSSSQVELMLIAGYSGIGKSVLVQEIYKPITQQRGYFISGKFDQYQRNIPYFAIAQAFESLIKQLLTEDDVQLCQWRDNLLTALASNSRVITQVIPTLELIVGNQPDVPILPPTEAQNRFHQVFQNFIRVFTQPEHPLVVFLDDLQWADNASLKLIQLLATSTEKQSLLLMGAYRDNEVNAAHPLIQMVEEIRQGEGVVNQLSLAALSLPDINQLIADTLHCQPEDSLPLAELVQLKTGGNPFFINEFLKSLYTEGLLEFDRQTNKWQWSIEQIHNQGITDNIVELMAGKIQKLNIQTQQMLQLSACIGNSFDLETLAFAAELSQREAAQALGVAIAQGLILPMSNAYKSVELDVPLPDCPAIEYKFAHDRIQQAAYSLMPEARQRIIHLQLGKCLLQNTPVEQREQKIFDITNQLNLGKALIQQQSERDELAELNYLAGNKASASAAYNSALQYFQTALSLLAEDCWQRQYALTLKLYIKAAEAEYLNIHFEQANILAEIALNNAANLLDRVRVYELQMQICMAQIELVKAIEIGLQVLEQLDSSLVVLEKEESLLIKLPSLATLSAMPVMTDPYKLSAMQILIILCGPVFMAKPESFPPLIITMINLCLEHGNSSLSAFGYGLYGLLLSGTGRVEEGYHAGKIALELLEMFNTRELTAKIYNLFNSNIRTWKEHAKNSIAPLQEAVQVGLDTGDIEWGGYAAANLCSYLFFCEENLAAAVQQQAIYVDLSIKLQQEIPTYFTQVWRQLGLNLRGFAKDRCHLIGESFNEADMLPRLIAAKTGTVLYIFYVAKTILLYHFGEYDQALKQAHLAQQQAGAAFGFMQVAVLNFYHSLALLADYLEVQPNYQETYLQQVEANQKQMQFWAHHAPMNYLHKWYLVEAERYRVLGQVVEAMDAYDRAITLARENEYLQEEALANELAAKFYLANNRITIAKAYLQEARYGYLRWGATAKVEEIDKHYPQLLEIRSERTEKRKVDTTESAATKLEILDLETVLKASQAIASEILLDKLLAKLMTILIENAGAQTGYLVLPTQDEWRVEAMGSIGNETVAVLQSIPLESRSADSTPYLPTALINYVVRTQESVILDNAAQLGNFQSEPWIVQHQSKSILCAPLLNQGKLTGIVLLENNLTTSAFTPERIEIFSLLSTQAAISIDNARLLKQQAELNESLRAEITERQRAEKDRDRLITILEASTDYIGMADPQGNILWNNTQANKLAEKPLNKDSAFSIPNYHPQWALELVQNEGIPTAVRDGTWVGETALIDRDGREFPVSQLIIAHKASDGSLEYLSSVTRDISALKAAEAEVRQLNTELEERVIQRTAELQAANKALEAFSYSVSHDLRAPLRAIVGFSRMIQEDYGEQLDAEGNRYLKVVRENAKRMGELIDDLLNLSRLDRKEMYLQPVLPNEIIQQVLSDLASDLKGRQIEFAIADLPICQADPSLLKQVWINLLSNAIKYTRYKSSAYIEVGYEVMDGEGVYFIKDNGAGFNMRYADNLFGVFQRLHREQDFAGTGIGLAIVQRIIQRHSGRIWAEAAVAQGATFYFTVPNKISHD